MNTPYQSMNEQHRDLYHRIQAFSFDEPDAQDTFCQRLAKDNGWSLGYAQSVIEEYRKFVFLAVVSNHPVSPSDPVDQAWHLHLSYTRSYWLEFCPNVLHTPFHHEPSRGGLSERSKLYDWYSKTLESYVQWFGCPPATIWAAPNDRFGRDLQFVRVNTRQTWLIPKPSIQKLPQFSYPKAMLLVWFTLPLILTGCQAVATLPNPLNFSGPDFLLFYVLLSVGMIGLASWLRSSLRLPNDNPARESVALDVYETAYLAEGAHRVVDTAIAHLIQIGYVTVQPQQKTLALTGSGSMPSHPIEQAVVAAIAVNGQPSRIRSLVTPAVNRIAERLRQLELLVSSAQSLNVQAYPAAMLITLLGLGLVKVLVGISRGRPVGFLIILCIVVALIGLGFWFTPVHRSRYGDRILQDLRARVRTTSVNSTDPHLPLVFALVGIAVLPNDMFSDFKKVFTPSGGDGGGSGDSGGGDGGGDGGGCGGCGGCGG